MVSLALLEVRPSCMVVFLAIGQADGGNVLDHTARCASRLPGIGSSLPWNTQQSQKTGSVHSQRLGNRRAYHRRRVAATAGSGSGSDFAIGGLGLSRYPSAIAGLLLYLSQ